MRDDLVQHLKPEEVNKKVATLELSNLKKAVARIKSDGLLTVKSSGSNKPGGTGHHEKWEFKIKENANPEFIRKSYINRL
ncbi:unnamed protein product [Arabis nemorensis]|uniref:Uncharacterized protein n=1 Tax=Arabis nemorensis TaxID=586526 RepID=A0A565AKD2_9BRAS|nr:unnamed protein product [Arabis nemorensis]